MINCIVSWLLNNFKHLGVKNIYFSTNLIRYQHPMLGHKSKTQTRDGWKLQL